MDQIISDTARAAGCSGYFMWEIWPDIFASQLMAATKRYSRFLKDFKLAKSHSDALGIIARASGFQDWHGFHSVVQSLLDAFDTKVHWPRPEGGREPIKKLVAAFPFMVQASSPGSAISI